MTLSVLFGLVALILFLVACWPAAAARFPLVAAGLAFMMAYFLFGGGMLEITR